MSTNKIVVVGIVMAIIVALYTVFSIAPDHSQEHGLKAKIEHHSLDSIPYEKGTDALWMKTVPFSKTDSAHSFLVEGRSHEITSFPCTNCHSKSLNDMKNIPSPELKKAHWNIKLAHAGPSTMNCQTCHHATQPDELTSLTAQGISFDRPFELCGQCHTDQYKDWQGGAHGKRLSGWKSDRVVKSCVSCHNPHSPAIESRWPSRYNTKSLEKKSTKASH